MYQISNMSWNTIMMTSMLMLMLNQKNIKKSMKTKTKKNHTKKKSTWIL